MKVITVDDALRALNEAVKVKGYDYKYERRMAGPDSGECLNTWEGKPDCIVGYALVWLGVPVEWFTKGNRNNCPAASVCSMLESDDMFTFEHQAVFLLNTAQQHQDVRVPWGEAVTKAWIGTTMFEALHLHMDVTA